MKNTIKFSADQEKALRSMLSGHNVFLTGEAGTGKSTVVEEFKKRTGREVATVAPTGVAAINVGGQTIHSMFRLGFGIPTAEGLKKDKQSIKIMKLLNKIDTFIIDEISMVRADILFAIDYRLRQFCNSSRPFGGKQIIAVGDFFQLPPVVKNDFVNGANMREADFLELRYGGIYAFSTPAWKEADFRNEWLTTIHRQGKDKAFIGILNNIRHGIYDERQLSLISHTKDDKATVLTPTRAVARKINNLAVKALPGPEFEFKARVTGEFIAKDEKKVSDSDDPAPRELTVKKDLRVILLCNDRDQAYVNGDVGTVTDVTSFGCVVRLDRDDRLVSISEHEWTKTRAVYNPEHDTIEEETIGTFTQLPMRPAYAITIHKSQGMTLEKVHIDLGNGCFAHGQLYVALSRCRSLAGLSVNRPITEEDVICDATVEEFYKSLSQSADPEQEPDAPHPTPTVNHTEEETVTMVIPKCISDVIADLIERYKIFGEQSIRQKYDYVATDATIAKRVKKADIESEVNSYSDETQDKLSSFTTAEKEFYCMLQKADKGLKAKDIAEEKKVSEEWARRTLAKLVKAGLVERRGSKKTGAYHPTKNEDEFSFTARCHKCPIFSKSGMS